MNRALIVLLSFLALPAFSEPLDSLRVNFGTGHIETDPGRGQTALEAQVLTALYEGLVVYDPLSLRALPGAAQGWAFSDDGLTLTFSLRAGLTYEDGTPLTSRDFRDSWIRLLDPKYAAPFASLLDPIVGAQAWREGKLADPKRLGIDASDAQTLVLKLAEPAPHLVAVLCHYAFVPVHPAWRAAPTAAAPPANGPYRFVSQEKGRWLLEKNAAYWDAAHVSIPTLDLKFNDDAPAVTKAYKEGTLDWVADGIDGSASFGDQYLRVNPVFGTSFLYFKTAKAPWTDARVRQALILLLPLEEWHKSLDEGGRYFLPTSVLVPQFQGYPRVEGITKSDKEKALALLAEAGFPNGRGLPPITVAFPDTDSDQVFVDDFRQAWKDIGLEVVSVKVEGNYYDKLATLDHTIGFFSWIGDFLDPVTFLVLWKGGSSLNSFSYLDDAYDNLLAQAALQKPEERLKTLSQAETSLLQGGMLIPLSHTPSFNLVDTDEIGGWYKNALDIHPFKSLYRKAPKPLKNLVRFDLP